MTYAEVIKGIGAGFFLGYGFAVLPWILATFVRSIWKGLSTVSRGKEL